MKRILLVAPKPLRLEYIPEPELRFLKWKALMLPLSIATMAALTPDDIEVDLWDEQVQGWIDEARDLPDYDLIGLTGYLVHIPRAREIAQVFRKRGIPVAIGGVGVSSAPEYCRNDFDILFIEEAELTWPQFIADWKTGNYRKVYRQVTKPDLALSPPPCWDSIADQMDNYFIGAVQATRGCPFECEFCDVIYHFGRQTRHKPIDRLLEEVNTLEHLGMERIFLCDDNFIGNPRYAKGLLRELISLNNSFRTPIEYITQLGINVAKNEEMLELLADANFCTLFIGIETPNKESLKEANKYINVHSNLIKDCKKVQSYGLNIRAGIIVGFDHDTPEIFDQQFEFLQKAGIPLISIKSLKAVPGTKLWHRLKKEGRVLKPDAKILDLIFVSTNIIPRGISRIELLNGHVSLLERTCDWSNFVIRFKRMISCLKRKPNVPKKKWQWKRFFQHLQFLHSMDKESRRAILSILWYTLKHAPFMIQKLFPLIAQQYDSVVAMRSIREKFRKLIELEKSIDMRQFIDRSGMLVTESLKKSYYKIFPDMYKRIYQGLIDKTRTYEVLIEVFTDFLIRREHTLDEFSGKHRVFLHEFADRAIAKENSTVGIQSSAPIQSHEIMADIKQTRLAEEILKAVEQELRR